MYACWGLDCYINFVPYMMHHVIFIKTRKVYENNKNLKIFHVSNLSMHTLGRSMLKIDEPCRKKTSLRGF